MNNKWIVVHSHPNKELLAADNIEQQGFMVYVPRYKKTRKHARKVSLVLAPLFPRYFFVALDPELDYWSPLNNTPGVSYLLRNKAGFLSSVPTKIIDTLKQQENNEGLVTLAALELFKPGDKVRILDGAFVNHVAIYDKMTDDQRVQLLINLIQREVKITMPLATIEKV